MIGEATEEEASLYVLGLLPPDEARRFEAAIAADAELAELVARLETGAAAFAFTVPPRDPPPALRGRIMNLVRAEHPAPAGVAASSGRIAWLPWAVAACLAVLAGNLAYQRYHLSLLVDDFRRRDQAQQRELDNVQGRDIALQRRLDDALAGIAASGKEKDGLEAQLGALRGQLAELNARDTLSQIKIATLSSMLKNAPRALAVVAWDNTAQRGILKTVNMPAPHPDQDYQLWIIDPDYKQPISAGIFAPDEGSTFEPAHPIAKASQFAISLEKKGGSTAPHGPIVLVGE